MALTGCSAAAPTPQIIYEEVVWPPSNRHYANIEALARAPANRV
ncbi:MAG: hypothetical protein ABSC46_01060 [Candidatus Limnocylindrales bacterium]